MAAALAILGTACRGFTSGKDQPVAIEFAGARDSIKVGDTVFVPVRVLNRDGDSIPGSPISLTPLDPDTLAVDSARQAVIGLKPGPGRIVATSGSLRSNPFRILVSAP